MIASVLLFSYTQQGIVADLDALAQKRDVAGISRYYEPGVGGARNPLTVLRTGGSYGVGEKGWRAYGASTPNGRRSYVVFSTPKTTQDIGEQVFELKDGKLAYVPEPQSGGWKIKSHDFVVRFRLAEKKALITDTIMVDKTASAGPLLMRFGPNYRMDGIKDDAGKAVPFSQAGGLVILDGPESSTSKLHLTYTGIVDQAGYAGAITPGEAMLTNDYWYPMIGRWPAPYKVKIVVPKGWIGVGQGELVEKTAETDGDAFSYRMDLPIVYYSLSAGPYKPTESTIDNRKFTVWSLVLTPEQGRRQAELYAPIFKFYERFAPYPFSGYGAMDTPLYGGGALEAYSYATYGSGWLPDEDSHEPAHTWWGGMISNTYLKSAWNESFAEFCTGLYQRNSPIGNTAERSQAFVSHPQTSEYQLKVPLSNSGVDAGPAMGDLGYGKGGWVLQMLEQELGTEKMVATMRKWLEVHPKDVPGEWEDFERVVGPDYKWFFDQWVHKPGYAEFLITDLGWKNGEVTGRVTFNQPIQLLTDVLLQYPDKSRVFTTVRFNGNGNFSIPSPKKPAIVSLDPWRRILRKFGSDEAPESISSVQAKAKIYTDPKRPDYATFVGKGLSGAPAAGAKGTFVLVGHPDTMPAMKALCAKVGFVVKGDSLTYDGTTIDLRKGAARAIFHPNPQTTYILALGQTRRRPDTGDARLALTDDLGRFLRGQTAPKTSGNLTFKVQ